MNIVGVGLESRNINTNKCFLELHKELNVLYKKYCNKNYCEKLKFIGFGLLIDSNDLASFGFEGCEEKVELKPKRGYVNIDIGFPYQWNSKTPTEIRNFVANEIKVGSERIVKKLMSTDIAINEKEFIVDIGSVLSEFMDNTSCNYVE